MRRRLFIAAVLAFTTLGVGGCHIPKWMLKEGAGSGPKSDPNLLTQTELLNSGFQDLWDAVSKLRPTFLTGTGRGAPAFYFNGVAGSSADLHNYLTSNTIEVKYTRYEDARAKYGEDVAAGGVVEVKFK